jgi:putative beta barrel porin BBP7
MQPTVSVKKPSVSPQSDAGDLPPPDLGVPPSGGPSLIPETHGHRSAKAGTPTGGEYFDFDSQVVHDEGYPETNVPGSCGCDYCRYSDTWFSARGDYLLWWTKGERLPPLVTTSPIGTPRATAGVLGEPTTTVLFGDTDANDQVHSGIRLTLDAWLTCNEGLGIEASYFALDDRQTNFGSSAPILARPFFDVESLRQDAELIAYPGVSTGSINICAKSELQGAEVLLRGNWFDDCCRRLDFLVGYRYLRLAESLAINSQSTTTPIDGEGSNDPTINVTDQFRTLNHFNGIDFGIAFERRYCRWSFDLLMKIALGSTSSRVTIDGSTVIANGQTATATPGGLLAAQSNMGTYDRDLFSVVPELGVTVGYDVTCQLRATLGYTFIYWSQVARPADQIDLNVNPGGGSFPQFNFHCADFWAQGFNLGLEYRY